MFYGDCVVQSYIFLLLATKWKQIIGYWTLKERPFLRDPYAIVGMRLSRKIRIIGCLFFVLFLIEHLTFIGQELHANNHQLVTCNQSLPALDNYMRRERPHLHDALPASWWIFPFFQWTISCMAFCWNYVDYFIITISFCLSARFNQLNERLRRTPLHSMDRKFWLEVRVHYTNLVDLLQYIDERISLLVLLSMSHNLFLICTKFFEAAK